MGEQPKRPLSSFFLWLNENREAIKRENPGIKVTQIAKRGGELWRGLKDKSEWENKAAKMKDEYTKTIKEFEANGGTQKAPKKRGGKPAAKAPAKKSKKKDSEDEDDDDDEESN